MASDYLAEAKRNRRLLLQLVQTLNSLKPEQLDLQEKVSELKSAVVKEADALGAALMNLDNLKARDPTGSNPVLQAQYPVFIADIQAAATYCAVELVPALQQLRRAFDGMPEADVLDRVQVVLEARTADLRTEDERWREERGPTDTSWAQTSQTRREAEEGVGEPAVVAVSPTLLGQLQAHQERLGDYIQGYISCQALSARCDEARASFEEARAKGLKTTDWDRVRRFLNEMLGMVTGPGPAFKGDVPDFENPVGSLRSMVTDARGIHRAATSVPPQGDPEERAGALIRYLVDIRNALEEIAALFPPKVEETLGELRYVINQIFRQIAEQREARQPFTERAGDPTKILRKPFAGTDSIAGKGA